MFIKISPTQITFSSVFLQIKAPCQPHHSIYYTLNRDVQTVFISPQYAIVHVNKSL